MKFVGDLMNEPWLKAFMFPASGRMTLTVKGVRTAEVAFDDQEPKVQTIMSFEETTCELTLAKINAIPLIKLLGNDVALWPGRRVTFYATNQVMPHPLRKDEPVFVFMAALRLTKRSAVPGHRQNGAKSCKSCTLQVCSSLQ